MQALKRVLLEDPTMIYVGLGMVEVVLLAVWRRYLTPRRALALAAPLLLAGAVFLIERSVVTDAEVIVAALDEIAHSVSTEPRDAGTLGTYLDRDVQVDIGGWARGVMNRDKTLRTWSVLLNKYKVGSASIRNAEVEVTGDSARSRFTTHVTYGSGKETQQSWPWDWTVDWIRRPDGWRIIGVDPPTAAQPLGL